jgi:hypothetical protein
MAGTGQEKKNSLHQTVAEEPSSVKPRVLSSWLDGFMEYTEIKPSPAIFRKWAGISTIAGAMERKVWVRSYGMNLYPNLYVILVGTPAAGKTVLSGMVQEFWGELSKHHMAPSSVSRASLIDALRDAERHVIVPKGPMVSFNSLLVASNELGVFLTAYDNEFINTLTDLYDGRVYSEKKRSKELNFKMDHPQLNLIASTTVSYLNNILPEGAWQQGFTSRTIFIYSSEFILRKLFIEGDEENEELKIKLVRDLQSIGNLYGRVKFTEEAAEAMEKWHSLRGPPIPDHPKLTYYLGRRTAHLLKLCLVACVSRGNELIVTIDHYNEALGWLLEAETFMPEIFKAAAAGGDASVIADTHHYAYSVFVHEGRNVSEARILEYLQSRVPAYSVERILMLMVKTGILEKQLDGYKPRPRKFV